MFNEETYIFVSHDHTTDVLKPILKQVIKINTLLLIFCAIFVIFLDFMLKDTQIDIIIHVRFIPYMLAIFTYVFIIPYCKIESLYTNSSKYKIFIYLLNIIGKIIIFTSYLYTYHKNLYIIIILVITGIINELYRVR